MKRAVSLLNLCYSVTITTGNVSHNNYCMFVMPQLFNDFAFQKSASSLAQCPDDVGIEVAFIGRSNAGKSSALNAVVGRQRLAKTSKTPGHTQLINFFAASDTQRLVDLPGYGYAKVPDRVREQIERMLSDYLGLRQCLYGVVLLMDIRHPLTPADQEMLSLLVDAGRHVHILLTKCDKLKRGPANAALLKVRHATQNYGSLVTAQTFSAMKLIGIEEIQNKLLSWFSFESLDDE